MYSSAVFYERLSALCRQHSTSITLFAKNVLHTSTSAPTNWKNGTVPSAEIVYLCAQEMKVSADYLLGLTDTKAPLAESALNSLEAEIIHALRAGDSLSRRVALASMHAVLNACQKQEDQNTL